MSPSQSKGCQLLDNALDLLRQYDLSTELAEREKKRTESKEKFREAMQASEDEKDWVSTGVALHFLKELSGSGSPLFLGVVPGEEACRKLKANKDEIQKSIVRQTITRAEGLRNEAVFGNNIPYLCRQRFLEDAIRMVWELCVPVDNDYRWPHDDPWGSKKAFLFIARCYLDRARLVLPKGSSVPEKKLEALKKAWDWAERGKESNSDVESIKLLIEIGLERERYDDNFPEHEVTDLIGKLAKTDFAPSATFPLDWEIVDRGCRPPGILNKKLDEKLFSLNLSSDELKKNRYLPLLRARSALRLSKSEQDLYDRAKKAVNALNAVPFSSFIWDETIDFLDQVRDSLKNWRYLAVEAWAICRRKEREIPLGLQVRMYWSRHNQLYNLAFNACNFGTETGRKLSARIVDSLKSRPTIKWLNIEKSIGRDYKKIIEKLHEIESQWALNKYILDYHKLMRELKKMGVRVAPPRPITDVPEGWAAVHFYLDQQGKGHAIIFNGRSRKWDYASFLLRDKSKGIDLWQDFKAWQAFDRDAADADAEDPDRDFIKTASEAGPYLKRLCHSVGQQLHFLFDDELSENLILIPHGFFHLVPIHAAINNGELLLEKKTCIYLPAWSLAPTNMAPKPTDGMGLFVNWEEDTFDELYDRWPDEPPQYQKCRNATGSNVRNYLDKAKNPHLVVILCHGEADPLNPYNARLLLKPEGQGLTHGELVVRLKNRIEGAKIVLGACETDLAPAKQRFGDEHLSLATAFLQEGASEIAGNLWRVMDTLLEELLEHIVQNMNISLFRLIREKQIDWWNSGLVIENSDTTVRTVTDPATKLYLLAPFRVVGFPEDLRGNK